MISPERMFFTKLIKGNAFSEYLELQSKGIHEEVLPKAYRPALEFTNWYIQEYHQLPSEDEVVSKCPGMRSLLFQPSIPEGALRAIYDNLIHKAIRADIHSALTHLIQEFQQQEVGSFELLHKMQELTTSITGSFVLKSDEPTLMRDIAQTLLDEVAGKIEKPVGAAPSLLFVEDQCRGWQPGGLTAFVAKPGVGKTWQLLMNAVTSVNGNPYHFYNPLSIPEGVAIPTPEQRSVRKKRCLLISMEMPSIALFRRAACLLAGVSYARFTNETLQTDERRRLKETLESLRDGDSRDDVGMSLKVIGPNVADSPDSIYAAAEDFQADMVFIDGFYLLKGTGDSRWQKLEGNLAKLRLHTLQSNRHYMLASQLKPAAKTVETTTLDDLAFSQSISQDCTNVLALIQEKHDKENNTLTVSILKMRDGIPDQQYVYDWDIQEGNYTQQGLLKDDDHFDLGDL